MNRYITLTMTLAITLISLSATAAYAADDPCIKCHTDKTPGIVAYYNDSAHFGTDVSCATCHGDSVKANHDRTVTVDAKVCAKCHKQEANEHLSSKHALGMKTGQGCTRNLPNSRINKRTCDHCHERGSNKPIVDSECAMFLAQSPSMQRQGCSSCHRVEARCDTCHTKHGTNLTIAGSAGTCGTCHMGPDHAQLEMWRTSTHGVLYESGQRSTAPTCVTCHMNEGTHNVSLGIATGKPDTIREAERDIMLSICAKCHTKKLAGRSLEDADNIESQSKAILSEAQQIIEALALEGLLKPDPAQRKPHPLFGKTLVLGAHMLYENLSGIEAVYFKMKMFYYMSAFKGAFHQNPDYAHWFGNAPLKLALSEIKSQAELLREMSRLMKRIENMASGGLINSTGADGQSTLKQSLRQLNEKFYSGKITEKEYLKQKKILLDSMGL